MPEVTLRGPSTTYPNTGSIFALPVIVTVVYPLQTGPGELQAFYLRSRCVSNVS